MLRCVWLVLISIYLATAHAQDIAVKSGAMMLNANLEKAADWPQRVVLMTHGTFAFSRAEIMTDLQQAFKKQNLSSLAINISYAIDNRASAAYDCAVPSRFKHTDAVDEIGVWLNWLKQQGAQEIVLLGHSRGGNQTAWFAAERNDPIIQKLVLISPNPYTLSSPTQQYKAIFGKDSAPILVKARNLVTKKKGTALLKHIDFLFCPQTTVTAEAFVSHYAAEPRFDTLALLKTVKPPTLVVVGSADEVVPDLAKLTKVIADDKRIYLKVVEGADHFFRDLYAEDLANVVIPFVKK